MTEILYKCGHTAAEFASGAVNRWGIPEVAYCINGYPVGLGLAPSDVEQVVDQAFKSWSRNCGLRFRRTTNPNEANILMGVARGKRAGFDGPEGVLAYCYLPQGNSYRGQVEMYWDLDEAWATTPGQNGILLLNVTAHELGHGLGLDHTNVPRQLMNPIYSSAIGTPQDHDIKEVVDRYGKPTVVQIPPPIPGPQGGKKVEVLVRVDGIVYKATEMVPQSGAITLD